MIVIYRPNTARLLRHSLIVSAVYNVNVANLRSCIFNSLVFMYVPQTTSSCDVFLSELAVGHTD